MKKQSEHQKQALAQIEKAQESLYAWACEKGIGRPEWLRRSAILESVALAAQQIALKA